jgi:hypothetical protein
LNGNAAGRITRITSQAGVEERKYGRLGETVYEKKTVNTFTGVLSARPASAVELKAVFFRRS